MSAIRTNMTGMQPPWAWSIGGLALASLAVLLTSCSKPGAPASGPAAGQTVRLPAIVVNPSSAELQIDGQVCLEQGILEYLAVATGGKEYESLFSLACQPSHLQSAMLIAGYDIGEVDSDVRGDFAGGRNPASDPAANARPAGAPQVTAPGKDYWTSRTGQAARVTIGVEVRQADGTWKPRPIESFLTDRRTGKPPGRMVWAFTGSFFAKDETTKREYFTADAEKSLIALWYDPTCLLNLTQDVGNPYRGDASGLEVSKADLPAKGTPIRLVLRKAPADRGN
ncbi:MAG TPA: YdjY domain-containing protein [Phycisphaerae bacterium]|nr:YdjY domain-containing protein [Phycisphaerae bacterium]HRY71389.1 YdjY domain-containing protein [Phycisphaerae bacterium]HSA28536.1 YdjY domain-containing protein [Phycisphaerae bacterium]